MVLLFFYLGVFVTTQLFGLHLAPRVLVHVLVVSAIVRFRPPEPKQRPSSKVPRSTLC